MITDQLGTEITTGCFIAYAVRDGSCYSALRIGLVTGVAMKKKSEWRDPEPRISVTVLAQDFRGEFSAKKTVTSIPERAIVLHSASLPEEYLRMLEEA